MKTLTLLENKHIVWEEFGFRLACEQRCWRKEHFVRNEVFLTFFRSESCNELKLKLTYMYLVISCPHVLNLSHHVVDPTELTHPVSCHKYQELAYN
jgi:hypothetical protein